MESKSPAFEKVPPTSMAPPSPSAGSKKCAIANLMSPPDVVVHSFGQIRPSMQAPISVDGEKPSGLPVLMSPPTSPGGTPIAGEANVPLSSRHAQVVQDPILYPVDDQSSCSAPQLPLFAPVTAIPSHTALAPHHQRIVDEHVRDRSEQLFRHIDPPKKEEYALVLFCRSQVIKNFTQDPRGWLRQEKAYLEQDKRASTRRRHLAIMPPRPIATRPIAPGSLASRPNASKPSLQRQRPDRVLKPLPASRSVRRHLPVDASGPVAADLERLAGTMLESSRRVVTSNREDIDFDSISDYSPPLDSLPERPNSLKADWSGKASDLSNDPHASLLHPDELTLASVLRLSCATYLTNKRRIFERRLQCLRNKKEFRKTDAQQACKIDVNKASKLWTAFDKVGWLDAKWFIQYL